MSSATFADSLAGRERSLPFSDPACWLAALCACAVAWLVVSGKKRRAPLPTSARLIGPALVLAGAAAALRDALASRALLTNCLLAHDDLVCRLSLFSVGALVQMAMMLSCALCSLEALALTASSSLSAPRRTLAALVLLSDVLMVPHALLWLAFGGGASAAARAASLFWVWCLAPSLQWQWHMRRSASAWFLNIAMFATMAVHWLAPAAADAGWSHERIRNSPLFSWQYAWYIAAAPCASLAVVLGSKRECAEGLAEYAAAYCAALALAARAPAAVARLLVALARAAAASALRLYGLLVATWWYACNRRHRTARASEPTLRYAPVAEEAAAADAPDAASARGSAAPRTSNAAEMNAEIARLVGAKQLSLSRPADAAAGRLSVRPGDEGLAPLQDNPALLLLDSRASTLAAATARPRASALRASWAWITHLLSVPDVGTRERADTDARAPRLSDSRELAENFATNPAAGAAAGAKGSVLARMREATAPKYSRIHTSLFDKLSRLWSPVNSPPGSVLLTDRMD